VQAVALPEFARLQDRPAELTASAGRCIRVSAVLTTPALILLAASADELTAAIGPRWSDATGALRWLCLAGAGRALTLFLGPLLMGIGRPHALAGLLWATAIPSALVTCAAAWWVREDPVAVQAAGIAASRAALFLLVLLPLGIEIGRRLAGVRIRDWISAVTPSVAAGALAAGAALLVGRAAPGAEASVKVHVSIVLACGSVVGAAALLAFDAPLRRELQRLRAAAFSR
jgi:O-antigen/teichoic acid export membrane protein